MHIVLYHPARLPVEGYGGTQRVVVWLTRGLAELGHRVTLISAPGSRVPEARMITIDPTQANQPGGPDLTRFLPGDADVLHAHVPLGHPPASIPSLWTLHGNRTSAAPLYPNVVALSADHARRHGISHWVHNGLDPAEYRFSPQKRDYDLFLGRMHSIKGWQWAMRGARRADRRIILAGGWRPIWRPGVRFAGRVQGERKLELLAGAACLWVPAQWHEPFGLTTIEAMVSGTPVLGTNRGALPEIVTPESGAVGDTLDELVARRADVAQCDPFAVRQRVLDHFTHRTMAERYVALYRVAQTLRG